VPYSRVSAIKIKKSKMVFKSIGYFLSQGTYPVHGLVNGAIAGTDGIED
jgi:hypothetical protein